MAAKKKSEEVAVEKQELPKKYTGGQLLKMQKYNSRAARTVLKTNESYSFEEADALIEKIMKKKG